MVTAGLYLLPSAMIMGVLGTAAGRVARRFGSKVAVNAGSAITAVAFAFIAVAHAHPYDMLISAALLGTGIGLAFSALGNLIVTAVPPEQTGVATGMNTVMRTLGGALGGQIVATFIANNVAHGLPTVTGFTDSFILEAAFLTVAVLAAVLVPSARAAGRAAPRRPGPRRSSSSLPARRHDHHGSTLRGAAALRLTGVTREHGAHGALTPRTRESTVSGQASDRYKWIALSICTLGVLLATLDASITLIAMPDIFRGGPAPDAGGDSGHLGGSRSARGVVRSPPPGVFAGQPASR